MPYSLEFHPDALDEWRALDNSVRTALKRKLAKRLEHPHVPASRLHGDLANCYKIKHDRTGHRLVYEVMDDRLVVQVIAIGQRSALDAYRRAAGRTEN